jgi:hypothetical protein
VNITIQIIRSTIKPSRKIVFFKCQGLPAKSGGGYLCLAVLHTSGVQVTTKFSVADDAPPFVLDTDNSIPFSFFLSASLWKLGLSIQLNILQDLCYSGSSRNRTSCLAQFMMAEVNRTHTIDHMARMKCEIKVNMTRLSLHVIFSMEVRPQISDILFLAVEHILLINKNSQFRLFYLWAVALSVLTVSSCSRRDSK